MRAANFIHGEIWVEHLGWKYAQLGDRFEIGRRISSFYAYILCQSPPAISSRPFPTLSQAVIDMFLFKATTSTINPGPLVSAIASSPNVLESLYNAKRFGDARRLIYLLESHLQLAHLVLNYKQAAPNNNKPSLLEQGLCAKVAGSAGFSDSARARADPMDVLARFVKERDVVTVVPLEAMRVLHALCASLSLAAPSPPTIIEHLSNPETTVASLVRIVEHPYEEPPSPTLLCQRRCNVLSPSPLPSSPTPLSTIALPRLPATVQVPLSPSPSALPCLASPHHRPPPSLRDGAMYRRHLPLPCLASPSHALPSQRRCNVRRHLPLPCL